MGFGEHTTVSHTQWIAHSLFIYLFICSLFKMWIQWSFLLDSSLITHLPGCS